MVPQLLYPRSPPGHRAPGLQRLCLCSPPGRRAQSTRSPEPLSLQPSGTKAPHPPTKPPVPKQKHPAPSSSVLSALRVAEHPPPSSSVLSALRVAEHPPPSSSVLAALRVAEHPPLAPLSLQPPPTPVRLSQRAGGCSVTCSTYCKCLSLFLGFYSVALVHTSDFMLVLCCLRCRGFMIYFEVREFDVSSFVLKAFTVGLSIYSKLNFEKILRRYSWERTDFIHWC
ncbi:hypothetical protein H1C71_001497 [Ictidomys tridecemlineatus]|nr:hypothetical protein H1C71_001497 [Ictidomys tridecemlineatus]